MIAGTGASLNVPAHVHFNILAADSPASRHHRVAHAVTVGTVHPPRGRIARLIHVTAASPDPAATAVIVPGDTEPAWTLGVGRRVAETRGGALVVHQPGLRTMIATRDILKKEKKFFFCYFAFFQKSFVYKL